jgi:hypothetical protein
MTKTLLWLSITLLVAGLVLVSDLVNVGNLVALYVALPAGAICLGLFLIAQLLQKETANFDQEQSEISAAISPRQTEARTARSEDDRRVHGRGSHERVGHAA